MKNILIALTLAIFMAPVVQAETDELPEIESDINAEYTPGGSAEPVDEAVDTQVLNTAPITIDGYLKDNAPEDKEIKEIKQEIVRQKQETILNKQKAQGFKALSKSVEVLEETTVEMLEEKRAAKEQIAEYNAKVKCLQQESPGPDCDKYVRRK